MNSRILTQKDVRNIITKMASGKLIKIKDPPLVIDNCYYNGSLLQKAYKKITKRGSGAELESVFVEDGVISMKFKTKFGKGCYRICSY